MAHCIAVALLGFTPFERANVEAHFRTRRGAERAYVVVDSADQAEFLVSDAHDDARHAELASSGRLAHTVVVGSKRRSGAAAQLPRPIRLRHLQRALDALPRRGPGAGEPSPGPQVQRVLGELAARTAAHVASDHAPAPVLQEHILVVDDDDAALRFMIAALGRFGFELHLARGAAEALARCRRRALDFVFVDAAHAATPGLADALRAACREAARRRPGETAQRPPALVLLARGGDEPVAGFDHVLARPLQRAELLRVIGSREVREVAFAETAGAATLY